MKMRTEIDSLGQVSVPADRYYGAQTQRALENFPIGTQLMPMEVIHAYALVKKAAAMANARLGALEAEKERVICQVCDEILSETIGQEHFPLKVWQTGSGTQTNMNLNEVISNRSIEKMGGEMGSKHPIHPNDDVNCSQS